MLSRNPVVLISTDSGWLAALNGAVTLLRLHILTAGLAWIGVPRVESATEPGFLFLAHRAHEAPQQKWSSCPCALPAPLQDKDSRWVAANSFPIFFSPSTRDRRLGYKCTVALRPSFGLSGNFAHRGLLQGRISVTIQRR